MAKITVQLQEKEMPKEAASYRGMFAAMEAESYNQSPERQEQLNRIIPELEAIQSGANKPIS